MKQLLLTTALCWLIHSATAATIPNAPHFVTNSAFANVLVNLSVETPMGGAAYADQLGNPPGCTGRTTQGGGEVGACYFSTTTYLGIFDSNKCYTYSGDRFNPSSLATNRSCGSGLWSGNFLNWATMTAADMFIWTMTGGDRDVDTATETILQRARVQNNASWFPIKYLANAAGATPFTGAIFITNHDQGGYQFKVGTARTGADSANRGTFRVRVRVCDQAVGLEANCKGYTSGSTTVYKPEGLIQRHADRLRFGVFAYTNDNSQSRDGGVLRAPMRYVGESAMDNTGQLIANPAREINPATGQIIQNPLNSGTGWSGVINYINRFHRDGYKQFDPISELFYEAIRYYKNLTPTPEYASGAPGGSFPIYTIWSDPIQFSCQKNFMVAINDANPWLDKKLPGTFFTCDKAGHPGMPASFLAGDCGLPSNPDTSINVTALTNRVGQLEGLTPSTWTQNNTTGSDTVGFVYGVTSNAGNCNDGKSVTVTNLSEVMGTCPGAGKQNSYYIAGLAHYANTTDLRGDHSGKQNVNTFMIDTQEYTPNPLHGNKNMLYLAGKYGGFVDLNDNDRPDLPAEWDADGDGQPDNYVMATQPEKLVGGLERAFTNILERSGTAANITANSTTLSTESVVFQAIFNSGTWFGDLIAYPVTESGVGTEPLWQAANGIPAPGARRIFTRSGGQAREFLWNQLSSSDRDALGSQDVLDYIRGVRSREAQNGGSFRNRTHVLGDIVHSSPFYVKDNNTVYVGANDGMLHAFDAANGRELFAYIPSAVIPRLSSLTRLHYPHEYFVDGEIAVSTRNQTPDRNILVATLGRGGKGLFGLDVTSPAGFGTSHVLWEYFSSTDADLGLMLGRPIVAKMNDNSIAVVVGNGYNSTSGKAVLYVFNLMTGALIRKIDTGIAGDNGLAAPGVFDSDGDGKIDFIYAGDLKGNVWKFDVSHQNPGQWRVAFGSGNNLQPIFVARDPSGNPQPITAQITVVVNHMSGDPHHGKRFLFFGTGSYFRSGDPNDLQVQTWYGLIDEDSQISGRAALRQRSIHEEGTFAGKPVRTFSEATSGDMVGRRGWYIDLRLTTAQGERIVTGSQFYISRTPEPILSVSSIIPVVNPCLPGGRGYINAINPFTGARLILGFFDVDNDGVFTNDRLSGNIIGSVDLGVGMPGAAVRVGQRLVVGGSSGIIRDIAVNVGAGLKGRISWREIVKE